jgi:hypothetical protein
VLGRSIHNGSPIVSLFESVEEGGQFINLVVVTGELLKISMVVLLFFPSLGFQLKTCQRILYISSIDASSSTIIFKSAKQQNKKNFLPATEQKKWELKKMDLFKDQEEAVKRNLLSRADCYCDSHLSSLLCSFIY